MKQDNTFGAKMDLPYSAQPILSRLDFSGNYVNVASANSTPTIQSIVDVISGQPASQTVVANQPTLARTVQRPTAGFFDAAVFNGTSQLLSFNSLAPTLATLNAFTVFVAFQATTPATANQALFTLGKVGADGYTQLLVSGSSLKFLDKNDSATTVAGQGGTVDTNVHWAALVSNNAGATTIYLDGTQVATGSVSGAHTYGTCSLGALVNNGSTTNYFAGSIFEVVVYKGLADLTAVGTQYFTPFYEPFSKLYRTY